MPLLYGLVLVTHIDLVEIDDFKKLVYAGKVSDSTFLKAENGKM